MREPTEMELRVAKAIEAAEAAWQLQKGDANDGLQEEPAAPLYVTLSMAAIRAMLMPTADMMNAMDLTAGRAQNFCRMIDAASPPYLGFDNT